MSRRDAKYAAGYRRCVEHSDNNGWDNPGFKGGIEGTAPLAPVIATVAKPDASTNKVKVTWAASTDPGTIDGTNYAAITGYTIKCSGISAFTATVAADATDYTAAALFTASGPASCTVTATNSANLSATSAVLSATLTKT